MLLPRKKEKYFLIVILIFVAFLFTAAQEGKRPEEQARIKLEQLTEEVMKEVETLRGWKFKHSVKIDISTEEQLRTYIEKKMFEKEYGGGKLDRVSAFLRMIGLIPQDCDMKKTMIDILMNQVGGFYDPDSNKFYVMERIGSGELINRIIMVHELTHALDDQYFDLEKLMNLEGRTEDSNIAIASVVEGSAMVLMTRYITKAMQSGDYDQSQIMEAMKNEMDRTEAILKAPPYFTSFLANFFCGMLFLLRGDFMALGDGDSKRVAEEVQIAMKNPPVSSEQILHPEKYWNPEERDEPVIVNDKAVEEILSSISFHTTHKDTVGELLCAILGRPEDHKLNLKAMQMANAWTNKAATGWAGDRFFLLSREIDKGEERKRDNDFRGLWMTFWDTEKDRDEFVEIYEEKRELPSRVFWKLGKLGAVFFFRFKEEEREAIEEKMKKLPLLCTHGEKPKLQLSEQEEDIAKLLIRISSCTLSQVRTKILSSSSSINL